MINLFISKCEIKNCSWLKSGFGVPNIIYLGVRKKIEFIFSFGIYFMCVNFCLVFNACLQAQNGKKLHVKKFRINLKKKREWERTKKMHSNFPLRWMANVFQQMNAFGEWNTIEIEKKNCLCYSISFICYIALKCILHSICNVEFFFIAFKLYVSCVKRMVEFAISRRYGNLILFRVCVFVFYSSALSFMVHITRRIVSCLGCSLLNARCTFFFFLLLLSQVFFFPPHFLVSREVDDPKVHTVGI